MASFKRKTGASPQRPAPIHDIADPLKSAELSLADRIAGDKWRAPAALRALVGNDASTYIYAMLVNWRGRP